MVLIERERERLEADSVQVRVQVTWTAELLVLNATPLEVTVPPTRSNVSRPGETMLLDPVE